MNLEKVYRGSTVLITGHTGFKGGWLSSWLIRLGANVIGFSRDIPTTPSFFVTNNVGDSLVDIRADVQNANAIKTAILDYRPDYIFHLAAQAIVSRSYIDPLETIATNVIGTANLLDALKDYPKKCSVVMVTSDKSYKNKEWPWGYRETDELGGADIYSGSKSGAEMIINSYLHSFFKDHPYVRIGVSRAGNVIGGGDWSIDRIVPDCFRAWSSDRPIQIRSPKSTRPWQHVLEPLSGYLTLGAELSNNHFHGEDFNFGPNYGTAAFPVERLIHDLYQKWPKQSVNPPFIVQPGEFGEAGLLKLNCDKALQLLGWFPACGYEQTISMIGEWYQEYYSGNTNMNKITSKQITIYEELGRESGCVWSASV